MPATSAQANSPDRQQQPKPKNRTHTLPEEQQREILPVSHATDILTHPTAATLPRYAAYRRARARFWEAFPHGRYVRLPTSGTNLECGFHALVLSAGWQLGGSGVRGPTLGELRAVFREGATGAAGGGSGEVEGNQGMGTAEAGWFTADQVADVFVRWGKRFLGEGVRCQLGWVMDRDEGMGEEGWPVMMNTPEVETGEVGEGIVRVWIWNDGASLMGGVGHYEGMRRPTEREVELMEGRR